MELFNYKNIEKDKFFLSKPFPNIELTNLWNNDLLEKCFEEIENFKHWDGEKNFFAARKRLYSTKHEFFPENIKKTFNILCSKKFINWLESFTGEKKLVPDKNFTAGGISSVGKGGFLKIHSDPNWNPKVKLFMRIIIIIYLNKNWKDNWGGHLEFWNKKMDTCEKKIKPNLNNMIIFSNNDKNYHGHPDPLIVPTNIRRNNLIMYYYSPFKNAAKENPRTKVGELSEYKERKVGEFGTGYYLNKIVNKITKIIRWRE